MGRMAVLLRMNAAVPYPRCLNCGLPFIPPEPGQLTCSQRCGTERHKHLDRIRRGAEQAGDRPLRNNRVCVECRARLSAYNRGTYCHACWGRLSLARRTYILKKNPGAEPVHGRGGK